MKEPANPPGANPGRKATSLHTRGRCCRHAHLPQRFGPLEEQRCKLLCRGCGYDLSCLDFH